MIKSKFEEENLIVKMYDPEILGVVQETFKNYAEASGQLGICRKKIRYACNNKKRLFVPRLNKEVVFRIAKRELANAA